MYHLKRINDQKLLERDYYVHTLAYYLKNWEKHNGFFHHHDHLEIMYIVKGRCMVEFRDKKYRMKCGDYILINGSEDHRLVVDGFCRIMNYEFALKSFLKEPIVSLSALLKGSKYFNMILLNKKEHAFIKDCDNIHGIMKRIILNQQSNCRDRDLFNQILIAELLVNMGKELKEYNNSTEQKKDIYVEKAISYIEANYDKDIKLDAIGKYIGIHENYLQRIFKEQVEMTVVDYLTRLRLEKAKGLLINSQMEISMIPEYIGINSVQYFIKLFKKSTDMTPLQFRKKYREDYQQEEYSASTRRCKLQNAV